MARDVLPFLESIRGTSSVLADGGVLFRAGEPVAALYQVEKGSLRLMRAGICVHVAETGTLFGESSLFAATQPVDAIAVGAATVTAYPKAAVMLHLKAHPDLALGFTAWMARRLNAARARLQVARLKGAAERVLAFLIQAGAGEAAITLDRPLVAVAAELGLTHEAFYRTLKKLEEEGRVERPGRRQFRVIPPQA
jgi:CRP-like cAMP-binding protein